MGKFSDKVFGANVDPKTIEIFNALQRGQYEFNPNESVTDLPEHTRYLGEKTTFARMWVALQASGSDTTDEIFYYSVNDNKFNSYEANQSIEGDSYFTENTENPYLKPTAGITSISSKTEGALGAVKRTTVEFVVHNKKDFDNIYLPFFLKPGATVVVDFGWSDKNIELYSIEEALANTDTELKQFKKFIYDGAESGPDGEHIFTNSDGERFYHSKADDGAAALLTADTNTTPPGWLYRHKGLVDTNIGIVTSYNSKVTQNGSFECSLELVSQNATILDNEISADNNLKFIFANKVEDILIQALTNAKLSDSVPNYNSLDAREKQKYLSNFFKDRFDNKIGRIPEGNIKIGIYHESAVPKNQESLYISFGLFNDLFLNNFVAKNKNGEEKYEVNFKISDYYVRYEENLLRRQTATMSSGDSLPVFLYPVNWKDSKDGEGGKNIGVDSVEFQKLGKNPYKTPVIPLREIFVRVSTIKEAFNKKQTVNDAINYILDAINTDSYGIFDLKMISPNRSHSEIGIQDNNLVNPIANEGSLLTFDVTSGNSVVSNLDYSFETPKGDLQNMLAIGNKTDQSMFDVDKLDNLNFLNVLKDRKREGKSDAFVRTLPINDVVEPDDNIDYDEIELRLPQDFFDKQQQSIITGAGFGEKGKRWNDLVGSLNQLKKPDSKASSESKPTQSSEEDTNIKILEATTDRDYWGKKAKLSNILKSQEQTISPVLPINLTLTIYGNTFLNIGDVFTINFLPKSYMPYVYFQILGVDHKIDSNWQTTYQTVFRVRPESKKEVVNVDNTVVKFSKSRINQEMKRSQIEGSVADAVEKIEIVDAETPTIKITTELSDEVVRKSGDKDKGLPNIIGTVLSATKVKTPQHVKLAYGWTQTILEYITEKQSKDGFKVLYHIRESSEINLGEFDSFRKVLDTKELEKYDVFVSVDVMYEDDKESSLKRIYIDQQSDVGAGRGISDDQEVVEAMMETESKKQVYKGLIDFLQTGNATGRGVEYDFWGKKSDKVIDKNFAPIISTIRFKTANLGSKDNKVKADIFVAKPETITPQDFIPALKLPSWFVINNKSKKMDDFTKKFYENIESITIPKKT